MNREDIESNIWEYLDNTCSDADRLRIERRIATDVDWRSAFHELSALHTAIPKHLEPDQPSLRFTKNVMDTVGRAQVAPATRFYINTAVIRGIGLLFTVIIILSIGYALSVVTTSRNPINKYSKPDINLQNVFGSYTISAIVFATIILGLVLLDSVARRKFFPHKHS